jgi:ABC-type transporter Mla MlaB component
MSDTQTVTQLRLPEEVLTEESLRIVRQYLEETRAHVVHLDLSGLQRPTAEGLGALVVLNKELRARGGALALLNVPAAAYEVFNLANLVGLLDVRRCLLEDGSVGQQEVQALPLDDEIGHATTAR